MKEGTFLDRPQNKSKVLRPGDVGYWELSSETKQALEDIDKNTRLAIHILRNVLVG